MAIAIALSALWIVVVQFAIMTQFVAALLNCAAGLRPAGITESLRAI